MATLDGALQVDPEKCTGCKQCALACSWVQTGTFQPSRSLIRVHVFDEQASYAPYACTQCSEAWCMQACPVNAIDVDQQTGAKVVIDEACGRLSPARDPAEKEEIDERVLAGRSCSFGGVRTSQL